VQPLQLVERVYELVEAREIDKAVMVCLRLARAMRGTFNAVVFLRELSPDVQQLRTSFHEATQHLSEAATDQVLQVTIELWLHERTFSDKVVPDEADRNVLVMGVGDLYREIENMERSIEDLRLPPGLGEYDTAAFTDQNAKLKAHMRLKIRACNELLERIRTRCLNYANRLEGQLTAEAHTSVIVSTVQREVTVSTRKDVSQSSRASVKLPA
jgi:hypothetical protein